MSAATLEAPTEHEAGPLVPDPPASGHVPAPGARIAAAVAVLALLVGVVAALPGGPLRTAAGFASLVEGPLQVGDDAGWRAVAVGETVGGADRLRAAGGPVTLDADGGRLVLAAGVRARVEGGRLVAERGSVLVDDAEPHTLVVEGVEVVGRGTWRVDAGSPPRVATYRGDAAASDGSDEVVLSGFEQVTVRDHAIGGAPALPLRYSRDDPFDREELGEAFRVDALATAFGRSLASTYGGAPRDAAFFAPFLAGDVGLARHLADLAPVRTADRRFGPPAEVLVGITVAEAVAPLADVPLADAAERVAALRDRGASWGLVLVAASGGADAFQRAADRVLDAAAADPRLATSAEDPVSRDAPRAEGPAGSDAAATAGPPPGRGDDRDDRDERDDPDHDDDAPVVPGPTPPAPDDGLEPVTDPIDEVEDDLDDVIDETTGTIEDAVGTVDDLLQPSVGELLGGG